LLSGGVLMAFWLRYGCLLFAVDIVMLRTTFAVAYVVEQVVEYNMEYVVEYLASCWLLPGCFLVAFWQVSGCFMVVC
jgi:hypothetical protein